MTLSFYRFMYLRTYVRMYVLLFLFTNLRTYVHLFQNVPNFLFLGGFFTVPQILYGTTAYLRLQPIPFFPNLANFASKMANDPIAQQTMGFQSMQGEFQLPLLVTYSSIAKLTNDPFLFFLPFKLFILRR